MMLNKMLSRSGYQTTATSFGIETIQEPKKAIDIFFDGNDVSVSLPIGYGKSSIYQAALVVDRFSSPEEPFAINLLPKSTLAKRILRLSFNFKLKLLVSCSDCLDWEKSRSFFTLAA